MLENALLKLQQLSRHIQTSYKKVEDKKSKHVQNWNDEK